MGWQAILANLVKVAIETFLANLAAGKGSTAGTAGVPPGAQMAPGDPHVAAAIQKTISDLT